MAPPSRGRRTWACPRALALVLALATRVGGEEPAPQPAAAPAVVTAAAADGAAGAAAVVAAAAPATTLAAAGAGGATFGAGSGAPAGAGATPAGLSRKVTSFASAFANGITMVGATELGDKTFWLAALMAMRYNRVFVFLGSIGALVVMTVLSVCIGVAVPALLPRAYTHYAAAALFAYFGYKLLSEAYAMQPGAQSEELLEAEEHLNEKGLGGADAGKEDEEAGGGGGHGGSEAGASASSSGSSVSGGSSSGSSAGGGGGSGAGVGPLRADASSTSPSSPGLLSHMSVSLAIGGEGGSGVAQQRTGKSASSSGGGGGGGKGVAQASSGRGTLSPSSPAASSSWAKDWPIIAQAFTITFVAEWGDRSQIATIAMAAAQEPFGVTLGACIGHALCTGLAVVGGRLLATRISERAVAFAGGFLFMVFALHSLVVGPETG